MTEADLYQLDLNPEQMTALMAILRSRDHYKNEAAAQSAASDLNTKFGSIESHLSNISYALERIAACLERVSQ